MPASLSSLHRLVLLNYFGLLTTLIMNIIWLTPPQKIPIALILLVYVSPWIFAVRGLLFGRSYTHLWASYLSLVYLFHALVKLSGEEQVLAGSLQALFSSGFFICALLYVRRVQKLRQNTPDIV